MSDPLNESAPPPAPPATVRDAGEHALIARLRRCFDLEGTDPRARVGIGDDAAVLVPDRNALLVMTTDALVEGVHFERHWSSPADIGHKAVAVNVSDLGAMGATPRHILVSLGLPDALPVDAFDALIGGIASCARAHRARVAGGNITSSPDRLFVDITAVGSVKPRKFLQRSTAMPGDEVYVTGRLGGAAAGLALSRAGLSGSVEPARADALRRFCRPAPPVRFGEIIGKNRAASACMDLSDGLIDGLVQLSASSSVGMDIHLDRIPAHPATEDELFLACQLALVLSGGEDYELLFTVPRRRRRAFMALARLMDVTVTQLGETSRTPGVRLHRADGTVADAPRGFSHFAG